MEKSRIVKFNALIVKEILTHQTWLRPDANFSHSRRFSGVKTIQVRFVKILYSPTFRSGHAFDAYGDALRSSYHP
jgi:hypothetical protein